MIASTLTEAQADIMSRMEAGATLTHSWQGERLWSLLGDPWVGFDDVSPRQLLAAGLIVLARAGSLAEDRADAYALTLAGQAGLRPTAPRAAERKRPPLAERPKSREESPLAGKCTMHAVCQPR